MELNSQQARSHVGARLQFVTVRSCSARLAAKPPLAYLAWSDRTVKASATAKNHVPRSTHFENWNRLGTGERKCGLCVEHYIFAGPRVRRLVQDFIKGTVQLTFEHDVHEKVCQLQCLGNRRPDVGMAGEM